jgi:hypothetical protein
VNVRVKDGLIRSLNSLVDYILFILIRSKLNHIKELNIYLISKIYYFETLDNLTLLLTPSYLLPITLSYFLP